jgi:glycosyltransferase involved in cell wall biosynthesis
MGRRNQHILFVLEHFHPYVGGIERLFQQLTMALAADGHRVTVITSRFRRELPKQEKMQGVHVVRVAAPNRYLFPLFAIIPAIRAARKSDLIQTSTFSAALPAFIAGKLTGRKVLITVHEYWGSLWYTFPWISKLAATCFRLAEKTLLSLPFHRYIAVSDHTAQSLPKAGVSPGKVIRIYNGVDEERLKTLSAEPIALQGTPHFIYFGRLGHSKGLDLIVQGGSRFLESHPNAAIELIIPETPVRFRKKLLNTIRQCTTPDRFIITPSLADHELFQKICSATAILIPSYNEGFCFAAAEATALGIPMVISNRGALEETAGGKVVVMKAFSADGFWQALEQATQQAWELRPVRRFPLHQQVKEYLELYQSVR